MKKRSQTGAADKSAEPADKSRMLPIKMPRPPKKSPPYDKMNYAIMDKKFTGKALVMNGSDTNKLVKGALLLTLAGVISKLLSAGYRIPLQNLTGDVGFYIYQQVYPILGIALVLSLYGFPSAVSAMAAAYGTRGSDTVKQFYIPVFLLLFSGCLAVFVLLFFNADLLANLAGDKRLEQVYRIASFAFLLVPFSALLRGIFQGNQQMKPTAHSQVGEQFVRVFVIIAAAVYIYIQEGNMYVIGQAAAVAAMLGSVTAVVILLLFIKKYKPAPGHFVDIPWRYYTKTLFILGTAAALNHMVLILIQLADAFTLVPGLMDSGLSQLEAMKAKGVFDRGQPLIQLGTVLGSSFALALIPAISREKLTAAPGAFYTYVQHAITVSFYLAVGATLGLIAVFPETNSLLFQNDKGTDSLRVLSLSVILSSIAITAASILQGLGYIKRTAGFILIAFIIKCSANTLLVPLFGITGGAVATVLSLSVLTLLLLGTVKRMLPGLHVEKQINWTALIVAAFGMLAYLSVIDFLTPDIASRGGLLLYVLFIVITGALLYIFLLLRFRAFTEKELSMLPFAGFWIRLHKEREIK
ncbi:putative polysaccharide biosynthesis protein [Virgibacillus ihumii]|uniref:putative polysaccharide biosynthesis protein n=1 Tax=Virgibacillus ihumii TaxID=2686091 RepID=UPI001FE6BEDD|nr:oligosaccharide flippase family protein [Virgibacillus ihumii]